MTQSSSQQPQPPFLPNPKLYTSSSIISSNDLSTAIINLVNYAFSSVKVTAAATATWDPEALRFEGPEELHAMLSDERSVMALIFDDEKAEATTVEREEGEKSGTGKLVACAAAVPWTGGWRKELSAPGETGWEIKIVCVLDEERYARRGLAVGLLAFLEGYLVGVEKERGSTSVALWIQAVESLNGVYWRRRGFRDVRRSLEGPDTWGCKEGEFEIAVFRRDVEFAQEGAGAGGV